MLDEFKKLANQITLLRILLLPVVMYFVVANERFVVLVLLIIIGLTDTLDGVLARKLKQESKFGANLDSLADNLVGIVWIFMFYWLFRDIFWDYVYVLLCLAILFAINLSVRLIKFKKLISLHTTLDKITNVLTYIFVCVILLTGFNKILFMVLISFAYLCIMEEIIILLTNRKIDENTRSIFD